MFRFGLSTDMSLALGGFFILFYFIWNGLCPQIFWSFFSVLGLVFVYSWNCGYRSLHSSLGYGESCFWGYCFESVSGLYSQLSYGVQSYLVESFRHWFYYVAAAPTIVSLWIITF